MLPRAIFHIDFSTSVNEKLRQSYQREKGQLLHTIDVKQCKELPFSREKGGGGINNKTTGLRLQGVTGRVIRKTDHKETETEIRLRN